MKKRRKKKKKTGLIISLLVLIIVLGAGSAYYFYERQKTEDAIETFLEYMKAMNFEGMTSLIQSNDLSALDEADIREEAYQQFFHDINQKMTYSIVKNNFSIQNGTAVITVKLKYIDGSDIYMETITEFLRQIAAAAFAGKNMTEEETQQKLAEILNEKAQSVPDKYTETIISYPMIKIHDTWKVVSLDDETVKIMSANFKNVQDEINNSLVEMETEVTATETDVIDMTNEYFTIHYTEHRVSQDFVGTPCILIYYDYTNNGSTAASPMVDLNLQASQNGTSLSAAILAEDDAAINQYMEEIQPGATARVCQAFTLIDTSDVTIQAGDAFTFGGGTVTTQLLKVQ